MVMLVALSLFLDHFAWVGGHVYVRSHHACKPIQLGSPYSKQCDSPTDWLTE